MAIHRENWNCLDKMSFNGEMGIEGTLISLQKIYQKHLGQNTQTPLRYKKQLLGPRCLEMMVD